ncbi:hypothetical protein [Dialister invisus]|uniref:hypothetical protein n=1 Tax=Dialister invisus TaxID=218538 RepID=UPI0039922DF6
MESKYEGLPEIKGSSWISGSFLSAAKSSASHEGSRKKIKAISCELSVVSYKLLAISCELKAEAYDFH